MRFLSFLLLGVLAAACGTSTRDGGAGDFALPFIVGDYDAALAEAKERDLPLFVETWAPW
jgi:hypothetical protein